MSNHLIHETSPYLLQHAHNPVDWYPWGDEALQKAKDENKPILVSIGYAACHWCHVMERESFEDVETAGFMNDHFINIKIDREERPDLDQIYMDAVQAMTGSGGWPLNVFLTPEKKPFYGGTYFPPEPISNRPSWKDVLLAVSNAFKNKRKDIEEQAEKLTGHLHLFNSFGIETEGVSNFLNEDQADTACNNLLKSADKQWGGFGSAPKFPQTFSIQYLLRYYFSEKKRVGSYAEAALQQALLSLDKMIEGGIYDQAGGGFARYSTDREWLAPHFEKMLYDNALLVSVLTEAFQITKNKKYKKAIDHTLAFIEREMLHPQGGFYSAMDADSEGEEGRFYISDYDEVTEVLGDDAEIFTAYYNITPEGNWEGKNILRILEPLEDFSNRLKKPVDEVEAILDRGIKKLMTRRSNRIRPALDDKVILGWNALMNVAYSKSYAATGEEKYLQRAVHNMQFLIEAFKNQNGSYNHVWKNNHSKYTAFLDDYAFLIQALLQLQKVSGDNHWLHIAESLCNKVIEDFSEDEIFFYYTPSYNHDVIVRRREIYDNATASGNAIMAQNLYELGIFLDNRQWIQRAEKMLSGMNNMMVKYPTSFGAWLCSAFEMMKGLDEIVLMGDYQKAQKQILAHYLPHAIFMVSSKPEDKYPLLKDKQILQPLTIYLCKNYSCQQPVYSVEKLINNLQL